MISEYRINKEKSDRGDGKKTQEDQWRKENRLGGRGQKGNINKKTKRKPREKLHVELFCCNICPLYI